MTSTHEERERSLQRQYAQEELHYQDYMTKWIVMWDNLDPQTLSLYSSPPWREFLLKLHPHNDYDSLSQWERVYEEFQSLGSGTPDRYSEELSEIEDLITTIKGMI